MLEQCIFTISPVLGRFAVHYVVSSGFILKETLGNRNIMGKLDKQPKNT